MSLSTHVLDTSRGCPAAGIAVRLERREPDGSWAMLGELQIGDDGRAAGEFDQPAVYRLTFGTGPYFASLGQPAFFPEVTVAFRITNAAEHYHVPLLISPFGYSTYRGT
jgi:5-hydroxyisourate hydrolase